MGPTRKGRDYGKGPPACQGKSLPRWARRSVRSQRHHTIASCPLLIEILGDALASCAHECGWTGLNDRTHLAGFRGLGLGCSCGRTENNHSHWTGMESLKKEAGPLISIILLQLCLKSSRKGCDAARLSHTWLQPGVPEPRIRPKPFKTVSKTSRQISYLAKARCELRKERDF